jgi:UPF0755 protein
MSGKKITRKACGSCFILPIIVLIVLSGFIWRKVSPVSASHRLYHVKITRGESIQHVGKKLYARKLVRSVRLFAGCSAIFGAGKPFQAGDYWFSPSMSTIQIVKRLEKGPSSRDITVTIPEGYTLAQIADLLARKGVVDNSADFLQFGHKNHNDLISPFPLPSTGLEGFLFPATYLFSPNCGSEKAAQTMLDAFVHDFESPYAADIAKSPHTLLEIVTIASLIEREAEKPIDRARIAGVIENRLHAGMPLDIDASVLYALGHHKRRVLYKDLRVQSVYNTYRHKGLPPGPIANPGLDCLLAALHPERNP